MPPFTDDNVTEPFVPPPFVDEQESESEPVVNTSLPKLPAPYEHNRPVIPSESDYAPFYNEPVYHEPSACHLLRLYRYRPRRGGWKHISNSEKEKGIENGNSDPRIRPLPSSVRLITWNVDIITNVWKDRINGILRHLQKVIESHDGREENAGYKGDAFVVLLQEVTPQMLTVLREDEWVRRTFAIVPLSEDKWPKTAYYGNVTLVSRDLDVVKAQIIHFALTATQRTGLLVYVRMSATGKIEDNRIICIVNTHLESLQHGERMRPKQLEALAQMLKHDSIEGGVIAGDMNAIGKVDRSLARKLGLKDAWRRGDSDPEGFTWGYQSLEEDRKYPAARLDKILFIPKRRYKVDEPQRIGVGLKVSVEEKEEHWVSDHYGLLTTLHMVT